MTVLAQHLYIERQQRTMWTTCPTDPDHMPACPRCRLQPEWSSLCASYLNAREDTDCKSFLNFIFPCFVIIKHQLITAAVHCVFSHLHPSDIYFKCILCLTLTFAISLVHTKAPVFSLYWPAVMSMTHKSLARAYTTSVYKQCLSGLFSICWPKAFAKIPFNMSNWTVFLWPDFWLLYVII